MTKAGADCVIFSSQTGVNVDGALKKLREYSRARRQSITVRKIESILVKKFTQEFPSDPSTSLIKGSSGMQYLVFKPKCLIHRLWNESLEETLKAKSAGATVFLSLHPIFYSSDSREYYSPVEVNHFRKTLSVSGRRVRMIISLIDDIYDVFRRLRAPNQLLSEVDTANPEQAAIESVLELIMLLDWRSQEMMRAEQLARSLDVPHYILATKHPIKVTYDLVFTSKTPVYVSHPISAVRNLQKIGKAREAMLIMEEINNLGNELVRSTQLIPFFPTTIDEYRIADKNGRFIPELIPRWPFGVLKSLLYSKPPTEPRNPLDPLGWYRRRKGPHPEQARMLHELLRALRERIGMQVGARDKKLVEQTEGLVVFRPYYGGNLSEGVQKEVAHRNALSEYCPQSPVGRHCVVASPREDLSVMRNRVLKDELKAQTKVNGCKPTEEMLKRIMSRIHGDQDFQKQIAAGQVTGPRLQGAIEASGLRVVFKDMPSAGGPLSGELKPFQRLWLANRWRELANMLNGQDPLQKDLDSNSDAVIASSDIRELVRRAESLIAHKK